MLTLRSLAILAGALALEVSCTPAPPRKTTTTGKSTLISTSKSQVTLSQTGTSAVGSPATTVSQSPPLLTSISSTTSSTTFSTTSSTTSASVATSAVPVFNGSSYNVDGVGYFMNKQVFTFNTATLPAGLQATNHTVYDTSSGQSYNHNFDPANVYSDGEFLNLKVPAVPNTPPTGYTISCAEMKTTESNILYASVRTTIAFSEVPGTCQAAFFYCDDNQETDIEYISDPNSSANNIGQSSANGDPIPVWFTNQATASGQSATSATGTAPSNVAAVHEYRIDWTANYTAFYVDGNLEQEYVTNVPSQAGPWLWSNWANGNPNWSSGPPTQDSIMKIQSITMYYNTTSD